MVAACLAVLMGALAANANAQGQWQLPDPWLPWAEEALNLEPKGKQLQAPRVEVGERGQASAIWRRYDGSEGWRFRFATKPPGGQFGPALDLFSPGTEIQDFDFEVADDGSTLIVWATAAGVVTAVERSPAGDEQTWTLTTSGGASPGLATGDDGSARIVWEQASPAGYSLMTAFRGPGGDFGEVESLSGDPYPVQRLVRPELAIGPDGTELVVWFRVLSSDQYTLYMRAADPGEEFDETQYFHQVRIRERPMIGIQANGDSIVAVHQVKNRILVKERESGGQFDVGYLISDLATSGNDDPTTYEEPKLAVRDDGQMAIGWFRRNPSDPEGVKTFEVRNRAAGAEPGWESWGDIRTVEIPREYVDGSHGSIIKPNSGHRFDLRPDGMATIVYDHFDDQYHVVKSITRAANGAYGAPLSLSFRGVLPTTPEVGLDRSGAATALWIHSSQQYPTPDRVVQAASTQRPRQQLTVNLDGPGRVVSESGEIDCTGTCTSEHPVDAEIVLEAEPAPGLRFTGWTGACSGLQTRCVVDLNANLNVTATFREFATVEVSLTGAGSGRVTSSPGGIDCGESCVADYPVGQVVTLIAAPQVGHLFTGWSGACQGLSPTCQVTVGGTQEAVADFTPTVRLTQRVEGDGPGRVYSSPSGIDCSTQCHKDFLMGQTVTLNAEDNALSEFVGWSGDCSGTGPACELTLHESADVTAHFAPRRRSLEVVAEGPGGRVISSPDGLDCGDSCSGLFAPGSTVTLQAETEPGHLFLGWSGPCQAASGPTCVLRMDRAHTVGARFAIARNLTVERIGTGSGSVRSESPAIDCGSICAKDLPGGTIVKLRAVPAPGSRFSGWSGACAGKATTCQVSLIESAEVTADFTAYSRLNVLLSGDGEGQVISRPEGIVCGAICAEWFPTGSRIELTASPDPGIEFVRWTGACSGTAPVCEVSLDEARQANAGFTRAGTAFTLPVRVAVSGSGSGRVVSDPSAVDCGTTCEADFGEGESVTLTAVADAGSSFQEWTGDCVGQGESCTLSVTQARSAVASFIPAAVPKCSARKIRATRIRVDRGKGRVRLLVVAAAPGRVKAKRNRLLVARGTRVGPTGKAWISLKPSRAGSRLLSRKGALKTKVRLVFRPFSSSCRISSTSRAVVIRAQVGTTERRRGRR